MNPMKKDATGAQASKTIYIRKTANANPTMVPMKRTPEGSVLTPGGQYKDAQPKNRSASQNMSQVLKGGAD